MTRRVDLGGRGDGLGEPVLPPAEAIGAAARAALAAVPEVPDAVRVTAQVDGFAPTAVTLNGPALAQALAYRGSAEELWQDALVEPEPDSEPARSGSEVREAAEAPSPFVRALIAPRLQVSLTEPESAAVLRAFTDASLTAPLAEGLVAGLGARLDLADTLDRLQRDPAVTDDRAVRSDVADFAGGFPVSLNTAHLRWAGRVLSDGYALLSAGMLEEMFAGVGGELLYRPFRSRWSLGGELYRVWKRRPGALPSLRTDGDRLTGFGRVAYDGPDARQTVALSAGRYLGRDWGTSLDYLNRFDSGWVLGASLTVTNGLEGRPNRNEDTEPWFAYGLSLTLPLGATEPLGLPVRLAPSFETRTLGRDAGQRLERPTSLRRLTDATGYGRIGASWPGLLSGDPGPEPATGRQRGGGSGDQWPGNRDTRPSSVMAPPRPPTPETTQP